MGLSSSRKPVKNDPCVSLRPASIYAAVSLGPWSQVGVKPVVRLAVQTRHSAECPYRGGRLRIEEMDLAGLPLHRQRHQPAHDQPHFPIHAHEHLAPVFPLRACFFRWNRCR